MIRACHGPAARGYWQDRMPRGAVPMLLPRFALLLLLPFVSVKVPALAQSTRLGEISKTPVTFTGPSASKAKLPFGESRGDERLKSDEAPITSKLRITRPTPAARNQSDFPKDWSLMLK